MKFIKIIIISVLMTLNLSAKKLIKINLSTQKLYAIEDGKVLFSGSVSSGKRGHRTPRGNFSILEKDRFHVSDKYPPPNGGAKMHYMLRLTNSGIAIHKGYLPGYPASHGCIRVSKETALKLWKWAKVGVKVKVYGDAADFKYVPKPKKIRYAKKHNTKRYSRKRTQKHYYTYKKYPRHSKDGFEVVEMYDNW